MFIVKNEQSVKSLELGDCVVDGLGHVADVLAVEAHHRDASVLQHVDVVRVDQVQRLRLAQASVGEHPDLLCDVLPTAGRLQLLQLGPQSLPHADHSLGNALQLPAPLLEVALIIEDPVGNPGSAQRRRRVLGPDDHLHLAQHP
jgi:hypothetical protein